MKSVIRPVRLPEDLDRAIDALADAQSKTRSQILRASPLIAWRDWFAMRLGGKRVAELVAEYHSEEAKDTQEV